MPIADGPAAAVGLLPDGRYLVGEGETLWVTDREGATASIALDYGKQRRRLKDVRAVASSPVGVANADWAISGPVAAIADAGTHRVWGLRVTGVDGFGTVLATMEILAGTGTTFYPIGDGAPAQAAQLDSPAGVAWTPDGNLLIADTGHGRVRQVGPGGRIATVFGTGVPGSRGYLASPRALAALPAGGFAVAEQARVTRIGQDVMPEQIAEFPAAGLAVTPDGAILASAGKEIRALGGHGGQVVATGLHGPAALLANPDGTIMVADTDRVALLTRDTTAR
ncbi:MAG: hypothetical protein FJZ00_00705 [Candidatus Sericytochromatia bacterium]|uniref:Gluconolaconase n=1 Tax=Candidatus Tanganyikabacteria bacterium TaxID=2961651 RepID=A0A937X0B0_9BACT|nr:hypothetical protein [Candidatus Tanganyikabacteria bacterium]